MRLSLFGLWLVALPLMAAEPIRFKNDREGESYYSTNANKRALNRALDRVDGTQIIGAFDESLQGVTSSKLCAYDVNKSLLQKLKDINPKFDELDGAIYHLRFENEIDDVVASILLKAHEASTSRVLPKDSTKLARVKSALSKEALPLIKAFETKYAKTACFDEAYRNLINDIVKIDKAASSRQIEALFVEAYAKKQISYSLYLSLERARDNGLQNPGLSLKSYYQKISSLRLQYPLRDSNEKSNYITKEADKQKMSHRQRLLENYSDIQIMMMGNVIKSLRARLESPKVEILIYDKEDVMETITLEPMERFRLAIKLLRKEMSYLSLNTYFSGRTPSYLDLMAAAYEVGIIPALELDELAGLQDIWNPKKTLWEKAKVWVQTLSTVATIVIPPPYGFLPALAIVVIEATTEKSYNANENDPTSLF